MEVYSINDLFFFPFYLFLVYFFIKQSNASLAIPLHQKRMLQRAYLVRIIAVVLYFLVMQFYYTFGDSFLYYGCIQDLHAMPWELKKDFLLSPTNIADSRIFNLFTGIRGYYMSTVSNALIVKLGYWFSWICGSSFLCICLFFSLFAYWGCRQLFLLFSNYYPALYKQFGIAVLFFPSICYWSSGLLKDSITLGAVGLLIFYGHSLLLLKKRIVLSALLIPLSIMLLLLIKSYILLALLPGLIIWLLNRLAGKIKNAQLKRGLSFIMVLTGVVLIFYLMRYLGSTKYASELATENLDEKIINIQQSYAKAEKGGSYFELGTTNIFLAFPLGINAALYRPYLWEVRNPIMFVSSVESTFLLVLTLLIWFKAGIFKFFRVIFRNADTLFFFIFTMIFAGGVGTSTPNFGTLVRYKIPCMPFFLMLLFIVMYEAKLKYPGWLNKFIGVRYKVQQTKIM